MKVEKGECLGNQSLLRTQWHGSYPKPADQSSFFLIIIKGNTYSHFLFFFFFPC